MNRTFRSQRGGSPLQMLAGILVMMGLSAYSMQQMQTTRADGTKGVEAIDRAKEAACATQRAQMSRDIVMFLVDYPGLKPSVALLEKAGTEIPLCPDEGDYEIYGRHVLCTHHSYTDEFEAAEKELKEAEMRRSNPRPLLDQLG